MTCSRTYSLQYAKIYRPKGGGCNNLCIQQFTFMYIGINNDATIVLMEEGNQDYEANEAVDMSLAPISWSASEFIVHQKTTLWYVALGAVSAVITVVVFVITNNILSGVVVAFACIAMGILAAKKPSIQNYEISEYGIKVGNQQYSYAIFKSYSVIDDGAISCIWLRPLKRLMPTVVMYYAPDDEQNIMDFLDNFLPQEDRKHDMLDRMSRRIRF